MSRIFLYCIVDSEGVFAEAAIKNEQGYTGGFLFKKILTFSIAAAVKYKQFFSLFDYDIIIQYIFIKINCAMVAHRVVARTLTNFLFCFLLEFLLFFNIITYFL